MSDFQDRLIGERDDLDARSIRLSLFISDENEEYADLHEDEKRLLVTQLSAMKRLSDVLNERIARKWEKDESEGD